MHTFETANPRLMPCHKSWLYSYFCNSQIGTIFGAQLYQPKKVDTYRFDTKREGNKILNKIKNRKNHE